MSAKNEQPLVSVIIPAYNAAAYIAQTIDSVLQQTYKNFEIFVIDDGSTDATAEVVAQYGQKVHYIRKQNGGGSSARNIGIAKSRGDFIAPLDADDLWRPDKLKKTMAIFSEKPETGMVFTASTVIGDDGKKLFDYFPPFDKQSFYKKMLSKNIVPNGSVILKKEILEKLGGYDESIFIPNDWDLWLRTAEITEIEYIPKPLTCYRRAATSISRDLQRQLREQLYVLGKVRSRNDKVEEKILVEAEAYQYYMMGYWYLQGNLPGKALKPLMQSLRMNHWGWKAWVLIFLIPTGLTRVSALRKWLLK